MRSFRRQFAIGSMICGGLLTLLGCGQVKEAELAHVAGVVRINGKPAANIMVQFLPKVAEGDPGPTASGTSDEQGGFELTTVEGKLGAVVGLNKVLFIDMEEERAPQGVVPKPPRIPAAMVMIGPMTQEVEVKTDSSPFDFDIKN